MTIVTALDSMAAERAEKLSREPVAMMTPFLLVVLSVYSLGTLEGVRT